VKITVRIETSNRGRFLARILAVFGIKSAAYAEVVVEADDLKPGQIDQIVGNALAQLAVTAKWAGADAEKVVATRFN
jgi:hypothetical protein